MPATRRPRPKDDDEELESTPRRRRQMDDEEDEAPRRRRPSDDDEEETPRRRRAETDEEEDYEDAPRSRRSSRHSDDDEEERPRRRPGGSKGPEGRAGRRPGGSKPSGRVASGWGGYNRARAASSDFEKKYKPSPGDGDVIQLQEPGPFAAFARHWVDLEEGKRAFICPRSLEFDEDEELPECPLCDVGDKPKGAKAYINVAVLREGSRPELMVWEIGGSVSDQLQTINKSIGRKTELTDIYLLASSSGSGLNTKYHLEPLFEEDLDEFEVKALTDKQRASFELYDASIYEVPSLKELNRVADEIA